MADVIRRLHQRFDRLAETPRNAVRGSETDDQHCQPDQPQQAGNQQRPLARQPSRFVDVVQRLLVLDDQAIAQDVEFVGQVRVATEHVGRVPRKVQRREKIQVIGLGLHEAVLAILAAFFMSDALIQQAEIMLARRIERCCVGFLLEH